jgi:hypothetical protein
MPHIMAELKTDKITLAKDFQLDLQDGWTLCIDVQSKPTNYTLIHGKKSINFDSTVMNTLCLRQYGIRLVKGRRQMIVPSHILQCFEDNVVFLQWYDPYLSTNQYQAQSHVTVTDAYLKANSCNSPHYAPSNHGDNSRLQT